MSCSEESGAHSAERRLATARNLRSDWWSKSVPSDIISPRKLSASIKQRDDSNEAQVAQKDTVPYTKEESESQCSIPIVDSSVLSSSVVIAEKMAAEGTADANEAVTRKEQECASLGKFLA